MPLTRHLVLTVVLAATLSAPRAVRAQSGEDVSVYPYGTVDLQLSAADPRALELNSQRRGNSPFSHLQVNLFADITAGDRLVVFNQVTVDPSAGAAINSYLRTWMQYTVLERPQFDLHLQAGKIPTPFGHFTERAYTDKNPLLGYPLMYHHFSSLRSNQLPASNADLLAHRGQGTPARFTGYAGGGAATSFTGLPMIYDSCWDFGGGLLGSLWRFEYLMVLTQGTLSDPRSNAVDSNDGLQVATRIGFVPATGVLLQVSWARGPYLRDDILPEDLPPGRDLEDYHQQIAGVAAQVEWRHLSVVGEVAANRWESPNITNATGGARDLEVTGFYIESRCTLSPGWFVAARIGGLRFGDIPDADGAPVPWDRDADRLETGTGYWLTDGVLAKLAVQWNRIAAESDATVAAADLMVRF